MRYQPPRLHVLVGGRDVTARCDSLTFSATDNGGFEIATLGLPAADRPGKGEPVMVRCGLEVAFSGRGAEIAEHSAHAQATKTMGAEGYRALMRDSSFSMIYADRDLTRWTGPSTARQIALVLAGDRLGSFQVARDSAGAPSLAVTLPGSYNGVPGADCWYDAGPGNLISSLYYQQSASALPAGWAMSILAAADDTPSAVTIGAALSTTPNSGYSSLANPLAVRFAALTTYGPSSVNTTDASYLANWANLALYGNHGLTLRGPDPGGFWPSDIARHALSQCAGIAAGQIIDAIAFIAPHVVYRTPTPADTIVDDMAKLMGWSWGVWGPGLLDSSPRLDFGPPPTDATAVVSRAECDQLDITTRLGDLYDVCQVTYTDPAGTAEMATVTLPNPLLAEAGIATRTLQLDMGPGSQAAAQLFASFALALSIVAARAAGTVTLPASVRLPGGGSKPACLLRPGIDRLRITDLPDAGNLFDQGTARRDVFRLSRVESTVARDGTISTVAELDNGANLLETLQARLALGAAVVGSGAS